MDALTETLAAGIHETWRALSVKEGWTMEPHLDRPYAELAPADKDDNRAAARRIADILGLAGMGVAPNSAAAGTPSDAEIRARLEHHIEQLAEAEHNGWMDHRLKTGWRFGVARDNDKKVHPLLIPYAKLSEQDKNKDRNSVRHFPDMVARTGYRIVWLKG